MPVEMRVIYLLMLKPHNMVFDDYVWLKDYEATIMLKRMDTITFNSTITKVKAMLWELKEKLQW